MIVAALDRTEEQIACVVQGGSGEIDIVTRLEELREAEELRRLFYVAVTRARDRLYLSAEIDRKGKLRRAARSLASLLPPSLGDVFTAAAGAAVEGGVDRDRPSPDRVDWETPHGTFSFRVCRAPDDAPVSAPPDLPVSTAAGLPPPLEPGTPVVTAATDSTARGAITPAPPRSAMSRERLTGTIVHRLMQRGLDPVADPSTLRLLVPTLVRSSEILDVGDVEEMASDAVSLYLSLRQKQDLARLLREGQCEYEVPFSFEPPDRPGD